MIYSNGNVSMNMHAQQAEITFFFPTFDLKVGFILNRKSQLIISSSHFRGQMTEWISAGSEEIGANFVIKRLALNQERTHFALQRDVNNIACVYSGRQMIDKNIYAVYTRKCFTYAKRMTAK